MIFQANDNQKMAKVDIFIVDRIDFKLKMVKRGRGNHYIMIKRPIFLRIYNTFENKNKKEYITI